MIKGKKTGQDDGNYTKIPNNILKARNLSSAAVRVLGLMIDRQSALESAGKLREDNLFYMVASAFNDAMDVSGTQVQRTILPELERKGLITRYQCPQDADSMYRRYAFYGLNWDKIYSYDGSQKDADKEEKKKSKGRKAQEVLKTRKQSNTCIEPKQPNNHNNLLKSLAQRLNYPSIAAMEDIDWDYPTHDDERKEFFYELIEKLALNRLGYISIDYEKSLNETAVLFSQWRSCSEPIAKIKLEKEIQRAEQQLSNLIKSLRIS